MVKRTDWVRVGSKDSRFSLELIGGRVLRVSETFWALSLRDCRSGWIDAIAESICSRRCLFSGVCSLRIGRSPNWTPA